MKNAMMWPFINDGIPILYYGEDYDINNKHLLTGVRFEGQEQGYTGGGDPNNREA